MSITSGGKSYNPSFPVANVNNNSKGFRDNFATIKFAIESLQTAQTGGAVAGGLTSNGSILKLTASSDDANGAVALKAEFNSTGFRLPVNRPASPAAGMICYENGVLFFHNGSVWQSFIERVGDTVTLPNIVVTTKLSINYSPSAPTDAVSVKWVQDYIAGLPSAGMDPAIYTRLDNVEGRLADEIEIRAQEDSRIEGLISTERARITAHDTRFAQVDQQITQTEADLNQRMDGVENLVESVSGDLTTLSQSVSNAVQQVNALALEVDADIAQERAERIAADDALSARIDNINNVVLADLAAEIEAERQARIDGDAGLQQNIDQTNTALNAERDDRMAAQGLQQNRIDALAVAFDQANAIVLGMSDRIDAVADDLVTERTNREAGDIAERQQRIAADTAERQAREQAIQQQQQALAAEIAAREQADTQQQQDLAAETSAREQADTQQQQDLAAETSAREQAAIQQQQDLAAEAQARADAIAAEQTARNNAIQAEQTARENAIADEATARDAAIGDAVAVEQTARNNAIQAEQTARNNAIQAEQTARNTAISGEQTAREQADADLQAQIDALEAAAGSNDYLDKSEGGTVAGPVTFNNDVVVNNSSFTLQNSQFYLPQSDITIDANHALKFSKLPNTTGSGDGAFITYEENNMRYAVNITQQQRDQYNADVLSLGQAAADASREFACLRIAATNDPSNDDNADSVAIEPAADLFLNPGWTGDSFAKEGRTQAMGISAIYVGDALDWRVKMTRATGDIYTKGRIDADGDIVGLSDESVKDNVTRITGALDKIEALTGVLYNRNDLDGSPVQMGLIAQDVKPVVPEVVHERGDGKLGIAYANLIGLLIEGIKELRAEVQSLKK